MLELKSVCLIIKPTLGCGVGWRGLLFLVLVFISCRLYFGLFSCLSKEIENCSEVRHHTERSDLVKCYAFCI